MEKDEKRSGVVLHFGENDTPNFNILGIGSTIGTGQPNVVIESKPVVEEYKTKSRSHNLPINIGARKIIKQKNERASTTGVTLYEKQEDVINAVMEKYHLKNKSTAVRIILNNFAQVFGPDYEGLDLDESVSTRL